MTLRMLGSCCGVQDFAGLSYNRNHGRTLLSYSRSLNNAPTPPPHTYVLFTGTENQDVAGLNQFILDNKLGETTFTGYSPNLRYRATGGNPIGVIVWRPDFKAFEAWVKEQK